MNRSHDIDGLTVDFIRSFGLCSPSYFALLMNAFLGGSLADPIEGSVTHSIFMKPSDIKCLKNWRPIALLNVDENFFSEVITSRMSKVTCFIIHPDQTFSVPGILIFLLLSFS